jgi:predicted peroxiredoxin
MQMLYLTTVGSSDPTRASVPLHLAVNGSVEAGQDVSVVLVGDASELLKSTIRDRVEGLGVPPVRDLFAKMRQHDVPVYV